MAWAAGTKPRNLVRHTFANILIWHARNIGFDVLAEDFDSSGVIWPGLFYRKIILKVVWKMSYIWDRLVAEKLREMDYLTTAIVDMISDDDLNWSGEMEWKGENWYEIYLGGRAKCIC